MQVIVSRLAACARVEAVLDIVKVSAMLDPEQVEAGYRQGLFPMGDEGSRVFTWHRPRLRGVLPLENFHLSRSLARTLRNGRFEVTVDRAFEAVMDGCAARNDVWITAGVKRAYGQLHRAGKAHSVEVWVDGLLAGGTYGVHLGGAFFAESKFHRVRDMSKVALAHLVMRLKERGFALLDVQYWTPHLAQFGVVEIPAAAYRQRLKAALARDCRFTD
ncbi:MAG: leucyl/phenylalanyl-tRNA--protein transferase [Acidobacteria bacterium]|nr:leucyl/phenylalanyl-tRNA--protein transferase [Acidobacteriota bacterium]